MTVLNVGLNKIKDLMAAEMSSLVLGTDGTEASEADSGVISPVAETEKSIDVVTSDKTINIKYILYSTEGNGNTYKEAGVKFSDGTALDRWTYTPVVKDNTFELHVRKRYFIKNG